MPQTTPPSDSILNFAKKAAGAVTSDYTVFDDELIAYVNTVFSVLYQIGYGTAPFRIHDAMTGWSEYLPEETSEGALDLDEIKAYVRNRVKLMFDPPASGTLIDLYERQCKEFECRVSYKVDDGGLS